MNYILGHASGGLGATSHRGLQIYRSDTCRAMGFLNTQETTRRAEQSLHLWAGSVTRISAFRF